MAMEPRTLSTASRVSSSLSGQKVAVGVERLHGRLMAEALLDGLDRASSSDE
jgi:hypothetical protein